MMRTMRAQRVVRSLLPVIAVVGGLAVVGCGDDDNDNTITNVVPTPVVVALKDSTYDFSGLTTFAMPDTVAHFSPATGTPLPVSREFDRAILDQVKKDLLARGYIQVSDPKNNRPDFVVLVGASATTNYDAYLTYLWYPYYGYYAGWGWFSSGFLADWGLVYPWYGSVGITSYDRGSLVVTLVPTLRVNPLSKTITAAWAGAATGLINGTTTTTTVTDAIDQMFALSPYLVAAPPVVTPH
jgi:hypothetical protein